MKNTRFEMKTPEALLARVDDWRRQQPDLPNRSEAIRRLIEAGLSVAGKSGPSGGSGGKGKTETPPKSPSRAKTRPPRSAAPEQSSSNARAHEN
jgi:hypothetical protein